MERLVELRYAVKILHVIHSVNPQSGGTIEGVKQLSAALLPRGVTTDVLSLDAPDAPWTRDFPFPLHALGPGLGGYGYTPKAVPWLIDHAADYDMIFVNGLWQFSGRAVWLASRRAGFRYCVFPHGMLDPWFKRRYPLKHLKKLLYWTWIEYRVLRDAAAVLFTAEEERLEARQSFRLYRCHERVLGYGITAPTGNATSQRALFLGRHPELNEKRLILFLGRIHEKKGCDLLLRAFREILSKTEPARTANLHLVMAGPCDSAFGERMKKLSRELDLQTRVTWTGMLVGDLKWGALRTAEAFILPSHQENFGLSVVEALACALPVLISNKVNIWREIARDDAGLVETDDFAGTVRLLDRWLALDSDAQASFRCQAARCFQAHFDMATVADQLILILTELRNA